MVYELPNPFEDSHATGVNSTGQAIGWGGGQHPSGVPDYPQWGKWGLFWDHDGSYHVLPGIPAAINDQGQVVGTELEADGLGERAFVWQERQIEYLTAPEPYRWSNANWINERSDVAGTVMTENYLMSLEASLRSDDSDSYCLENYGVIPKSPGPLPDRVPCVWLR
jgi:uncharacterized membrane protein